ncbi:MAG: UDP-N-acetylglucosamine--N-acetylmuramyl-(pentapeptide) pyrophosphoryl-undecaprenol N-acetylglucosamine transferase [bacterium]
MITRVAFVGGGTGGHLYPLLAVADELQATSNNLRLSYFGPRNSMMDEFERRNISIHNIAPSKLRRYFDIQNIIDIPKFFFGILQALVKLYFEMPDVIFSKGGPGALPVIIAAKWYMIPIVIHESDAVPGLTNRISAKFAKRVLLSFEESAQYFSAKKARVVGNPVRRELTGDMGDMPAIKRGMQLDPNKINILVLGGSQGSTRINLFILESLPTFLTDMQITHQTGDLNFDEIQSQASSILMGLDSATRAHYHPFPYFAQNRMREALGSADIVISRAGSGAIFEIAALGRPSILIPLSDSANDHQKENAYSYSKTGAAQVVEESNLTTNLVLSLIHSMLKDENKIKSIEMAAKNFFKPRAAQDISDEILRLAHGI